MLFSKIFGSYLLASWIADDPDLLNVTSRLLMIMDDRGAIDMDYPAIARQIRLPVELVIAKIEILNSPQGRSRDKQYEGRTLGRLDPDRPWGWRFLNFDKFMAWRSARDRRTYKNEKQRQYRARDRERRREQRGQNVDVRGKARKPVDSLSTRGQNVDNTPELARRTVDTRGQGVDKLSTRGPIEKENKRVPPTIPLEGGFSALDFPAAKAFLNDLFGREKRPWTYEEDQLLFDITPIEAQDARAIHVWFTLADDHPVWQKTRRKQELTTFLRDFNGELDKIRRFGSQIGLERRSAPKPPPKKEPPRWREFLQWRYDPNVRLPASFHELPEDLQEKYAAEFAQFEKEKPEVAT